MHFRDLTEAQILALAVTAEEEEDNRIYRDFAEGDRKDYPATAALYTILGGEENGHRHRLITLYQTRFGNHIPLIRPQDGTRFSVRRPSWLAVALGPQRACEEAALMEIEAHRAGENLVLDNEVAALQTPDLLAVIQHRFNIDSRKLTLESINLCFSGQVWSPWQRG